MPQTDVLPLSDEELQAFLAEFDQHSLTERRDYTASLLMVDTGLRAGETVGLSLDSINFEDSSITVVGKGNKKRTVYFGSQMAHILQDYIERCRPWLGNGSKVLFPSAPTKSRTLWMRSSVLSDSIRRKMKEAGVYQRGSSAHRLRHTFAVNFLRNGGGVFHLQELMGHSTLEMTRRYVRFAQADLAEAYKKASPVDALISNPQPS